MLRATSHFPRRLVLIALVIVCVIALGIATLISIRATPISRQRAIEIATLMCRVQPLVLLGEPHGVRAQLVTFKGTPAWQVELDGQLQVVGGPPTASAPMGQRVTATPPQPFEGTCTAVINAKTGDWIEKTGQALATPP